MPSVIDAPDIVEHEEHTTYEEQPQIRAPHPQKRLHDQCLRDLLDSEYGMRRLRYLLI